MFYLLNPKLWIAAILVAAMGFTHYTVYRTGKGVVQSKWDKERAELLAQAVEAEQKARATERKLSIARQQSEKKYVDEKRKAEIAVAAAKSDLDRLRDELSKAPVAGATCTDPTAASRAASGARLERELLGNCAKALTDLASEADRLEAIVVGLQQYVKNVCLAKN